MPLRSVKGALSLRSSSRCCSSSSSIIGIGIGIGNAGIGTGVGTGAGAGADTGRRCHFTTCSNNNKRTSLPLNLREDGRTRRRRRWSTSTSTSRFDRSSSSSSSSSAFGNHPNDRYNGNYHDSNNKSNISDEVNELINEYSQRPQTSVSLQTLTQTGKGELLNGINGINGVNRTEKEQGDDGDDDDVEIFGQLQSYPEYNNYDNNYDNYYSSYSSPSYSSYYSSSSSSQASQQVLNQVASFIHHEMPIRLARRIKDLDQVPYLSQMPSVQAVKEIYISSFLTLINEPNPGSGSEVGLGLGLGFDGGYNSNGSSNAREALFARKLELLYERHSDVLVQMAMGAYQLRELIHKGEIQINNNHNSNNNNTKGRGGGEGEGNGAIDGEPLNFEHLHECHAFLDRFYMSRIGIRVLAGQYLALRRPPPPQPQYNGNANANTTTRSAGNTTSTTGGSGYIGLIYQHTSPYEIIQQAVCDASYMCEQQYGPGMVPKVIIQGRLDLTFAYIPTHLHYIILELLKNAMRSTVEHHSVGMGMGMGMGGGTGTGIGVVDNTHVDANTWPPIEVIVSDGFFNEDVVIKIADEGGGIPRSNMNKIWSYLYTTADPSVQDGLRSDGSGHGSRTGGDHSVDAPLAGLGYGLPISRSYARYFGGDVSINSMEGYGTDAFVHLRRLGDSREPLPF